MHDHRQLGTVFGSRPTGLLAIACAAIFAAGCLGEMGLPPLDGEPSMVGDEWPPLRTFGVDEEGIDPDGREPIYDELDPEELPPETFAAQGGESCYDNIDNDGDGLVDCLDPACGCEPEACTDNVDNDGDGLSDCDDPQCGCGAELCTDNADNDGDGLVDCLDPDCDCTAEVCTDNADNDGDGLQDCADPQCPCTPEVCGSGRDDDGDGLVDCYDPDCDCEPERCSDNIDNDLDGDVDCNDSECDCIPEVCFDGVDNDRDGLVDCTARPDPECPCDIVAEGCRVSERIAFLNCNDTGSSSVLPAGYDVVAFTCAEVLAAPHLLNGFDTVAWYGGRGSAGWGGSSYSYDAMVTMLTQLYTSGVKVIVFANPDMYYLSVGDLSTHFHSNLVDWSTITVSSVNTMSDAFDRFEQSGMEMVQLHSDSSDWCGNLFFAQTGYNGHFHAFRRDTTAYRGILVYNGLYDPGSDVVDFAEPFVAANLAQSWNPGWGASDTCGLTCGRAVGHGVGKPVIYLYPEEETRVRVELDFEGEIVTTYPAYDDAIGGWEVIAQPDGSLVDTADGHPYDSIYWNGVSSSFVPNFDSGFVVRGDETVPFLQATLSEMGLIPDEYNDLITYWLPYMEHHGWNLIHFAGEEYTDIARMTVTPTPDSVLRVFMYFQEIPAPISVPEQTFEPFVRRGFTVVEWGGSEIGGDWHVPR